MQYKAYVGCFAVRCFFLVICVFTFTILSSKHGIRGEADVDTHHLRLLATFPESLQWPNPYSTHIKFAIKTTYHRDGM